MLLPHAVTIIFNTNSIHTPSLLCGSLHFEYDGDILGTETRFHV